MTYSTLKIFTHTKNEKSKKERKVNNFTLPICFFFISNTRTILQVFYNYNNSPLIKTVMSFSPCQYSIIAWIDRYTLTSNI